MTNKEINAMLKRQDEYHKTLKLKKEDVWGKWTDPAAPGKYRMLSPGMIVARSDERCPIFKDIVPYKSVTVVCDEEQLSEVEYWLMYVHGGDSISRSRKLPNGKVALRSDYQCW